MSPWCEECQSYHPITTPHARVERPRVNLTASTAQMVRCNAEGKVLWVCQKCQAEEALGTELDLQTKQGNLLAAVAAEREACAAICDAIQKAGDKRGYDSADPGEGSYGAAESAIAIRARGTTIGGVPIPFRPMPR